MIAIPKAGASVEIDVGGRKVELARIPVRRYDWDHRSRRKPGEPFGHPKEQALIEIRVDGKTVGLASRQHGWGKQPWGIDRLFENYDAAIGHSTVWKAESRSEALYEAEQIARKAVELRDDGSQWKKLYTVAEIDEARERYRVAQERRAAEEAANRVRWAAEEAERKRKAAERRQEVLDGLKSIDQRLGAEQGLLSNLEASALRAAIARYEADRV